MAKKTILVSAAAAVAGASAAAAVASPGTQQYGNPLLHEKAPAAVTVTHTPVTPTDPGGGSLPFTGLEIGLIVAGGCAATGAGFVVRRAARGRRS